MFFFLCDRGTSFPVYLAELKYCVSSAAIHISLFDCGISIVFHEWQVVMLFAMVRIGSWFSMDMLYYAGNVDFL